MRNREQSRVNKVGWVVDEVFCCQKQLAYTIIESILHMTQDC